MVSGPGVGSPKEEEQEGGKCYQVDFKRNETDRCTDVWNVLHLCHRESIPCRVYSVQYRGLEVTDTDR